MARTAPADSLSTEDLEELRLLYQTTVADIAFFKQQQFTVTNYALLLQTALVFVAYQFLKSPLEPFFFWLVLVLAVGISAAGLLAVQRLHASIEVRRERLRRVRKQFGRAFFAAWDVNKEPDDFRWLLIGVLILSAIISAWLVIARVWSDL
jgi:uncharacterized membrane protein